MYVSVEIDGRTYTHTVVNPLGGLTPPAQTITQIATDLVDATNRTTFKCNSLQIIQVMEE